MARLIKKNFRHKKTILVILLLLILAAGYWVYGQITTFSNKRDFQQAQSITDIIYSSIIKQVGEPDNSKKSDTCSRSYQEISGYGEINCDINRSLIYSVDSKEDAQNLIISVQKIINQNKSYSPAKPIKTSIETTGVLRTNYYGVQNFYKLKSLDCTSKYVYDTPEDTFLKLKHEGKPLYIVIGCSGPAKKQYYPLNQ
jgi:hypothetical protein